MLLIWKAFFMKAKFYFLSTCAFFCTVVIVFLCVCIMRTSPAGRKVGGGFQMAGTEGLAATPQEQHPQ